MAAIETADEQIRDLARRQHGVVARRQLTTARVPAGLVRRRLTQGRLEQLSRNVLRVSGSPATDLSFVMAAVLDSGPEAVASHQTAAALWGLPGFVLRPSEVTGRRSRVHHGRTQLAVVHQPRRLLASHVVELERIAVTTPTRTLFDLAGSPKMHPKRVERLLDTSWSRGLVSHRSLSRGLDELAARGRAGITLMRELLAARPPDHRPPGSATEARFQEIALRCGLRGLVRQLDVGDDDAWVGRVDFVDRSRALIIEVDPALWHGSLTDRRTDELRRARLRDAGWTVESISEFDIFHGVPMLEAKLRDVARQTRSVLVDGDDAMRDLSPPEPSGGGSGGR